jgi:hypothetical protein
MSAKKIINRILKPILAPIVAIESELPTMLYLLFVGNNWQHIILAYHADCMGVRYA